MARHELRTDQWHRIEDLLPGKASDAGRTARDNRQFVDAVIQHDEFRLSRSNGKSVRFNVFVHQY